MKGKRVKGKKGSEEQEERKLKKGEGRTKGEKRKTREKVEDEE